MKSWKGKLGIGLMVIALLAASFVMGGRLATKETTPEVTADLIDQRIQSIQELATMEYHYTNMGRYEDQLDFYGWKVPLTKKSFIISYDGLIKAGVDLSKAEVRLGEEKVTVKLPAAKILSHEIPEDSIQVFDETRNVFNPIQIEDYTGFTKDQKEKTEANAIEKGLLTEAGARAERTVADLLALVPGLEGYTIQVKCG